MAYSDETFISPEDQLEARQRRFNMFFSSLSKSEKKSLRKAAGDMDALLKAIFKLSSPEKIKEALSLATSDGDAMEAPHAAYERTLDRKQAVALQA